ncbi:MAG: hypothetical protein ACR2FY_18850 [Pirellulaceae bacterium]
MVCREHYCQWVQLDRELSLAFAYAINIDEADQVFLELERSGSINYRLTDSIILVQVTIPGWRLIEQMNQPPVSPPSAEQPSVGTQAVVSDAPTMLAQSGDCTAAELKGRVTFGVITVRDDEFRAVLRRFPNRRSVKGAKRLYEFATVSTPSGTAVRVAIARLLEQGHGAAQGLAGDFIDELNPDWLLLVGIAGGMPSHDFTLGDVLLSSRLHNFAVSAALVGKSVEFSATGGPMRQDVERLLAHLPAALEHHLGEWNTEASVGLSKPIVQAPAKPSSELYGERSWRRKTSESLKHHFPEGVPARPPRFYVAPTASSNTLVKDPELAKQWLESARHIGAIEMELGGVDDGARHASSGNCRVLAIRGVSDIVGYRRNANWTEYAC